MTNIKETMAAAKAFAKEHAVELAKEIRQWQDAGALDKQGDTKLRELADMLEPLDTYGCLRIAESLATRAALDLLVEQPLPVRDELLRLFTSYGNAMYRNDPDAAEAIAQKFSAALTQPAPEAQQAEPPQGATHYQPHQKAYYKRVSATEWFLWSGRHGWMPSKGTSDSSQWVTLKKLDTPPQQPAQAVPLSDEAAFQLASEFFNSAWYSRVAVGVVRATERACAEAWGVKLAGGWEVV